VVIGTVSPSRGSCESQSRGRPPAAARFASTPLDHSDVEQAAERPPASSHASNCTLIDDVLNPGWYTLPTLDLPIPTGSAVSDDTR